MPSVSGGSFGIALDSSPGPLDDPIADALAELGDIRRQEAERKLHEEPASKLIN